MRTANSLLSRHILRTICHELKHCAGGTIAIIIHVIGLTVVLPLKERERDRETERERDRETERERETETDRDRQTDRDYIILNS